MNQKALSQRQTRLDRLLAQRSLYYLCKEILGYKDLVPHVHGDLCQFATAPVYGRFRQATLPRSWFKTWVWTIGKSIWLTLPDEEGLYKDIYPYKGANVRILIASNVIDNAAKMVYKIKSEWMNNNRLQAAFPELIPDFNKTRWSDHVAQVARDLNATEGTYTAVGVGGSVISQHFDHIIEDDLIYARKDDFTGQELMPSQEDIDNAIGWHKLTHSLFSDPRTSCIDNVGTRWAPQDLVNYIRNNEKHYKCFEIAVTDDATTSGKPVWSERYPESVLEQLRISQGNRIFETQYLNRPRATEDIVFKKEYVNIHNTFAEYPKDIKYETIVDLAGWGDSKGVARNVILTGGMCDKNHLWIARVDVGRFNPSEVIDKFKEHSRQFGTTIHVEEVQYQRAIRHFSRKQMEETGEWFKQEQLPFDGRSGAKDLRIRSLEPIVTNGALHILHSMQTLLEELEFYPHTKTRDILDCLGYLRIVARPSHSMAPRPMTNQFSMEEIERELKSKSSSSLNYPFCVQVRGYRG